MSKKQPTFKSKLLVERVNVEDFYKEEIHDLELDEELDFSGFRDIVVITHERERRAEEAAAREAEAAEAARIAEAQAAAAAEAARRAEAEAHAAEIQAREIAAAKAVEVLQVPIVLDKKSAIKAVKQGSKLKYVPPGGYSSNRWNRRIEKEGRLPSAFRNCGFAGFMTIYIIALSTLMYDPTGGTAGMLVFFSFVVMFFVTDIRALMRYYKAPKGDRKMEPKNIIIALIAGPIISGLTVAIPIPAILACMVYAYFLCYPKVKVEPPSYVVPPEPEPAPQPVVSPAPAPVQARASAPQPKPKEQPVKQQMGLSSF